MDKRWNYCFGRRLEAALRIKKMTQRDLAEKVGTTEVTISRYVNGSRCPNAYMVVLLAKALGCSMDYMMGVN